MEDRCQCALGSRGVRDTARFDLSKSNIRIELISDAELAGLIQYLSTIQMRGGGQRVVRILQVMQELENLEEPEGATRKERKEISCQVQSALIHSYTAGHDWPASALAEHRTR